MSNFVLWVTDHMFAEAKPEIMAQECKVDSLNTCIRVFQRQVHSNRLELDDVNCGYEEFRREQVRLEEELALRETALRNTRISNIHEMEELRRAQEMRVDEFSVHKKRESHATIQDLTSQIRDLQERVNCMNHSKLSRYTIDLQWKIISRSQSTDSRSKSSIYVEPGPKPAIWYMEFVWSTGNVIGNPRHRLDSSQMSCWGILHSTNQSVTGGIPVQRRTGRPVARGEERIGSTIPMHLFAGRPSTTNSFLPAGIPRNYMAAQQRRKYRSSSLINSPNLERFHVGRYDSKIKLPPVLIFVGGYVMDQRSGDGWFIRGIDVLAIRFWKNFPNFEMLDARIASALNKIIQNSYFKKKVSLEEQKKLRKRTSFFE